MQLQMPQTSSYKYTNTHAQLVELIVIYLTIARARRPSIQASILMQICHEKPFGWFCKPTNRNRRQIRPKLMILTDISNHCLLIAHTHVNTVDISVCPVRWNTAFVFSTKKAIMNIDRVRHSMSHRNKSNDCVAMARGLWKMIYNYVFPKKLFMQ